MRKIASALIRLQVVMDDMAILFAQRWHPSRDWPGLFGVMHRYIVVPWNVPPNPLIFCVCSTIRSMMDSFPTRVGNPRSRRFGKRLYNPKYKLAVMKWQLLCDNQSRVIWMSGPHFGTVPDGKLWKKHHPALADGEKVIADLAYIEWPEFTCDNSWFVRIWYAIHHRDLCGRTQFKLRRAANVTLPLLPRQSAYNDAIGTTRAGNEV